MGTGAAVSSGWLALFPALIFTALGAILRNNPAHLGKILSSAPGPLPRPGEIRWLPRILLLIGLSWAGVFVTQIFPYPHGQRPYFIPLLEIMMLLASAGGLAGIVIWIVAGRRLLGTD